MNVSVRVNDAIYISIQMNYDCIISYDRPIQYQNNIVSYSIRL